MISRIKFNTTFRIKSNTILIPNESIDIRNAYKLKEKVQVIINKGYREIPFDKPVF